MKQRADQRLVELGLCESREKAKRLIMAGQVYAGTLRIDKASQTVAEGTALTIRGQVLPYVSRGGLKLEKAIAVFRFPVKGLRYLDVGASTGGFTDCLLQNGAEHVTAVDVGYGQLDYRLRNDPRVTVLERMNARYLKPEDVGGLHQGAVMDVSFISIGKVLPAVTSCLEPGSYYMSLVKPQFEAGREAVGNHGVVRDPSVHREVLIHALEYFGSSGLRVEGMDFSPIRGPEGNIEFLLLGRLGEGVCDNSGWADGAEELVRKAHEELHND